MPATATIVTAVSDYVARFHEHMAKGHREQALEEIARAQRQAPSEEGLWFFLTGLFLLQEGYAGRALKAMEQAFRREPESRECLYGVAMANSALGFYQEVLFCNKIGATTREIAHERGWGEVLTLSLRKKDRLLFATDERIVLARIDSYKRRGDFLGAALVGEDALLAFANNPAWRRAAIENYVTANRPFSAAALLQPFVERSSIALDDQVLIGEVFAALGSLDESLLWFERAALGDKAHGACRSAVSKLLFCSRPPLSERMHGVRTNILDGLPSPPRKRGKEVKIEERLRIGIVSSDLLLGGVVERVVLLFDMFDKSNIELFLYIDSPRHDFLTEHVMSLAKDHFKTHAVDDVTFARIVYEDGIDVLLDLDLRRLYARPAVARLKPAALHVAAFADPHEAHRWGYDAVLSDPFLSPPTPSATSDDKNAVVDKTMPCPLLRPRFGFLQTADLFEVQPIDDSARTSARAEVRAEVRVGVSASYAALDETARTLLVRCMLEVPRFELLFDSEALGGEKAAAMCLAQLEKDLPSEEHRRLRVLPEQSSLATFLRESDLLLDIAYPRSAYTVWQCLRHAVPVLTLQGESIPERLSFSVIAQKGLQELSVCDDEEDLLSRLRLFCTKKEERRRFRQKLQRCGKVQNDREQVVRKALSLVEALLEGVLVLGRSGRYQDARGARASL